MDHRESFGTTLFYVKDDAPTASQRASMAQAKSLIYRGLTQAAPRLRGGRAGVLVDEQYGQDVVDEAMRDPEASDSSEEDGGSRALPAGPLDPHPRTPRTPKPRRGPHGSPSPSSPPRVRTRRPAARPTHVSG